ncbi:MAG: TrkH family potassium uptake protein [Candidatus Sumerlaeia bacterium]|nr:TrkH family potassium uptake protein [Candidatus Sumerlaeia bacterium]
MNYPLVAKFLGLLLGLFSVAMLTALPFAFHFEEWRAFVALLEAVGCGMVVAVAFYLIGRRATGEMYRREALAVVGLSWFLAAMIGALPFHFGHLFDSFAACVFESMSGLTTTGASVLTDIEGSPKALLFWRSALHFIGGLGIVVLFVAVLPLVGVGGRALFKQEVSGPSPEGLTPRIKDTAILLLKFYVGINALLFVCLLLAGMSFFDAINHAMATIATGGYSTRNASLYSFANVRIEWVIILFMFLASTNFRLHLDALRGKFNYWKNAEFRAYTFIVVSCGLFVTALLMASGTGIGVDLPPGALPAVTEPGGFHLHDVMFSNLSVQSTTGFGTVDFNQWPDAARILLMFLMIVGGCAGSTSGGMKVIRWVILFKVAAHELSRAVAPRRVRVLKIDGQPIPDDTIRQVQTFFFLHIFVMMAGSVVLGLFVPDLSLLTIFTAVVSAINNIGPGLDQVGPAANFACMNGPAMWLLSLLMLLGRLELLAILVFLSRTFWFPR